MMIKNKPSHSSQNKNSYTANLEQITVIALWCNFTFIGIYTLIYWVQGYLNMLWGNIAALLIALIALVIAYHFHRKTIAAHLAVFGFYVSVVGTAIFSGGIQSPAAVWFVLTIVIATLAAGVRAGILWSIISFLTLLSLYLIHLFTGIDSWARIPSALDYLIEYFGLMASVGLAVLWGERIKKEQFVRQEELQEQLRRLATTDPLTSVYNRRHFFEAADKVIHEKLKTRQTTLILFDIDNFKKINDTYGHLAGDQVLKSVMQLTQKNLRRPDILARFGGEEFIILLADTSLEDGRQIVTRLHRDIEQTQFLTDSGPIRVTISTGIAEMRPGEQLTISELIQRADQAMYEAKNSGRNQIRIWQEGKPVQLV